MSEILLLFFFSMNEVDLSFQVNQADNIYLTLLVLEYFHISWILCSVIPSFKSKVPLWLVYLSKSQDLSEV
jgi:hypothetical protein